MAFPPATPAPNPNAQPTLGTNAPPRPSDPAAAEQQRLARRQELCPLPMTADQCGELWKAVERSKTRLKRESEKWKILLKEYIANVQAAGSAEAVKVPAHFYNVQTKSGQLFPSSPRIACIAKGPALDAVILPGQQVPETAMDAGAVQTKQAVLNDYLGPDKINAKRLMQACLFDTLAWAGFGACKVGYKATFVTVQQPVMQPDPNWQPPPIGGPGDPNAVGGPVPQAPMVQAKDPFTGLPQTRTVQVPIYEEIYANHFSPLKALWSDGIHSTDFDRDADWMGWLFAMPKDAAKREFALSDDECGTLGSDENYFGSDAEKSNQPKSFVTGVELWRKSATWRGDTQPHPLALDHIVLIDGNKTAPVVCRPSPDQSFDAKGRLTVDSMIGFPIHITTNRLMADSSFVQADSAFTNAGVKELNTYRRQNIEMRDAQITTTLVDAGHIEDVETDIIKHAPVGDKRIYVKPGALAAVGGARGIIDIVPQPSNTMDFYKSAADLKQDMQETLGISGPTALATPTDTVRSATEIAQDATAFAGRMGTEQEWVVACYIALARKVDALCMRYAPTSPEYVAMVGQDGTQVLKAWNRQLISGRYSYDIVPDITWRLDAGQRARLDLSIYNLMKGDPLFNRAPFMREIIQMSGKDPAKCIMTPEQIAAQAMAGKQQPPHGAPQTDSHEQQRTETTQNGPQSEGGPSRVMGG